MRYKLLSFVIFYLFIMSYIFSDLKDFMQMAFYPFYIIGFIVINLIYYTFMMVFYPDNIPCFSNTEIYDYDPQYDINCQSTVNSIIVYCIIGLMVVLSCFYISIYKYNNKIINNKDNLDILIV